MDKLDKQRHYWLREDLEPLMDVVSEIERAAIKAGLCEEHRDPDARSSGYSLVYPKTTEGTAEELRLRGLECNVSILVGLVECGVVQPAGDLSDLHLPIERSRDDIDAPVDWLCDSDPFNLEWSRDDIDAVAEWLYEHEHWNPWTYFCWVCNLRFGQCVQAHRVASARYGWGFSATFDVIGRPFYVEPAEDPDGYATIWFLRKGTKVAPVKEAS